MLVASTATTLSAAPADSIATGAATETAIGSVDSALASEIVDWRVGWRSASAASGDGDRQATPSASSAGGGCNGS